MSTRMRISLSVTTADLGVLARVAEQFAATAAGLAAENVDTFIMTGPDDDE